jgi:hypothetical protein
MSEWVNKMGNSMKKFLIPWISMSRELPLSLCAIKIMPTIVRYFLISTGTGITSFYEISEISLERRKKKHWIYALEEICGGGRNQTEMYNVHFCCSWRSEIYKAHYIYFFRNRGIPGFCIMMKYIYRGSEMYKTGGLYPNVSKKRLVQMSKRI